MLWLRVDQKLVFGEVVVFVALDFLLNIEAHVSLYYIQVTRLDYLKLTIVGSTSKDY